MKSLPRGKHTFPARVIGINQQGLWLDLGKKTYFLTFKDNPWFQHVPLSLIFKVRRLSEDHLNWDELDVDLHVDSLDHPEKYPLKCQWVQYPIPSRPSPGRVGQKIKRWPAPSMLRDMKRAEKEVQKKVRGTASTRVAAARKK